ncbi:NTP transferase domain-containing protein [Enterobacteriaceae bacterium H20N1]|uniref:NTP transferase domain-containing protein n=1 Tax=Dryocola boscaweniae TaxID=2925397 RepID=A0A9X2WB61_9ENTR|nr:NTP transferase domain-containing protein [Dryocola boscaweniae]MCT4704042.1 NTP transferase domain-containing protein [Dryocola boscaweniae]MCT4721210.1 NTP transferase domain-containing protein [Dryocola boscaweniae]
MPSPVVIILAAGRGERFLASGATTHKLDALLNGKPVLWHVLQAVKSSGLNWHLVKPEGGTRGMSDSIAMGVQATSGASGWLILPADLPLIHPASLQRVAAALREKPVAVPYYRQHQGHPVGFRREYFDSLTALSGDFGAREIVRDSRLCGKVLDLSLSDAGVVHDIDALTDLRLAQRLLNARARRMSG